ncbi:MAG TPA: Clp protease N-terminal domain-containing protein [Streptosporangiaceae bacterium]|nr:Clp protease N-terminal domain-containing protein [Streptosporangiaceae bacterium]
MFERFTDRARRVVVLAQEEARMLNHNYIGTEHLLLGLIHENDGVAAKTLQVLGIGLDPVRQQVEEIIGQGQRAPSGHIPFTPRGKRVLELSLREALQLGHNYIGTEHLLLGLIREGEGVAARVLVRMGADLNRVRQVVIQLLHGYQQLTVHQAVDLTAIAGRLGPVVGRDHEIHDVMQALYSDPPANPLLVGEHGVGTSTVVHGVARAISSRPAGARFAPARLCELDLAAALRNRLLPALDESAKLLEEMSNAQDTVFFVGSARESCLSVGRVTCTTDLLRPALIRGDVQVIATATPAEQDEWSATDHELYSMFQPVAIPELSEQVSAQVLAEVRDRLESRFQVAVTDAAITAAVTLSAEGIPSQRFPSKAISLMEQAASRAARRTVTETRDLPRRIADIQRRKDDAIDAGDFERAAAYRDQERALLAQEDAWKSEWKNTPAYRVSSVTAEDVAQALADQAERPARLQPR